MRDKTLKAKRETLTRLTRFLQESEFNLESCRGYMALLRGKGWKVSSINSEFRGIRAFITWLFGENVCDENWGRKIKLPKEHRQEIQVVPYQTAKDIIEAGCEILPSDNKLVKVRKLEARDCLMFILKSGLRNFEARGLFASDFNLEEKTFWVLSKGGSKNKLPIGTDLIEMLRPRVQRGGLMFRTCENRLQDAMALGCKKLNVNQHISVHSLRHIFATTLLRDGTPYGQTRRLMRHADTRILDTTYAHLNIDDLAISLNGSSLVSQGLTPKEKLTRIIKLLQEEVRNDDRFIVSSELDLNNSLTFNIRVRTEV